MPSSATCGPTIRGAWHSGPAGTPRPEVERIILGCDGVAMQSLAAELKRIGIVNHIVIDMDPGADRNYIASDSIAAHRRRSYQGKESDLLFDNL